MNTQHHTQLLAETKSMTGWTEVELAKRLGISQATVNRILHNQGDCLGSTVRKIQQLHAEVHKTEAAAA